jgi:heme a synthase
MTAYRPWLHYYAIGLSVATFLLLFAGGMVTSTNSGLAVPDWPTTFGQNMFTFPPSMMKGGIFYEHGHRLFASLVGLLTVGLCLSFWIADGRRWIKGAGTFGLLLVVVQGVLGGMTVRYKLPMPVSTAHACTAELFFALTVFLSFATSRAWLNARPEGFRLAAPGQTVSLVFLLAVFLQILVGAMLRHSSAGLAIPTFPLAFGAFVPPFWNLGIAMHFLHSRVGAAILVLLGLSLIGRVMSSRHARAVKAVAGILAGALLLQCLLGMGVIWTGKAPVPTTFHLSGGALVFASALLLFLMIYRLGRPHAAGSAPEGTMAVSPVLSEAQGVGKVAFP